MMHGQANIKIRKLCLEQPWPAKTLPWDLQTDTIGDKKSKKS